MKSYLTGNPTDTENKPTLTIVIQFELNDMLHSKPLESVLAMELLTLCHKYSGYLDGEYDYQVEIDYSDTFGIITSKKPAIISNASTMEPKIDGLSIPVLHYEYVLRLKKIF